jgi:hypothetical protein
MGKVDDTKTLQRDPVPTLPPKKATLTLDYLGTGSKPSDTALTSRPTAADVYDADSGIGGVIWVGIGVKDVKNLEYFLDGLYSADFAIDYDPEIFEPYDESLGSSNNLKDSIRNNNFDTSVTTTDVGKWVNAELYEASLQKNLKMTEDSKYNTEFVTIKSPDGQKLRLSGFADADSADKTVYLLRVPFKLLKMPDDDYTGEAITLNLTEQTFVLGATENGVTNSASWEGTINKTTAVNNAKNHFDGPEIVDIFGTNGQFNITGTVKAWNANENQPITVNVYKVDDTGTAETEPAYTFKSTDVDELGAPLYGEVTQASKKGEIEWKFSLPVSDLFSYEMVVSKQSHLTYPAIEISKSNVIGDELPITDVIELIVGDINSDQIIKLPDRAELMRFFNRQKPWLLYKTRFEAADLNGDDAVNLFDLELLKKNMENTYPQPASDTTTTEGGGGS